MPLAGILIKKPQNCGKTEELRIKMATVVIIGGGVSGLSAGIYTRLTGNRAIICEKHTTAGGNLTGWKRGEYTIDNCIHWLTGTNPATKTYKMWKELGALGNVEILQGGSIYTCEHNGRRLSLYNDLHKIKREMLEISPRDAKETRDFIAAVEYVQGICGIAGLEHDSALTSRERIIGLPAMAKYYSLSVGELAKRFSHPLLRSFIASFWGDSFGALALICVFAHFCGNNGGIPRGGSIAMAHRMEERFKHLGGELMTGAEVIRISSKNGKADSVILADGTRLNADFVVLTTDPAIAFGHLLDLPMPKRLARLYNSPKFKRFSCYHTAFACDMNALPFNGDFVIKIPPQYRPLLLSENFVLREFSHEKDFAPKGKNVMQTMTFINESEAWEFIELKKRDRAAYRKRKQEISSAIQELILDQFPEMSGRLSLIDSWTPATYRRYVGSEIGSFMSFTMPSDFLPIRLSNRIPGLSNVILATQWQQAPGGLPIAAECGKLAAETIAIQVRKSEAKEGKQIDRKVAIRT